MSFKRRLLRSGGFGSTIFLIFIGLGLILGGGGWYVAKLVGPLIASSPNDIVAAQNKEETKSEIINATTFNGTLVDFKSLAAAPGIIFAGTEAVLPDPSSLARDSNGNWVPQKAVLTEFSMQITKDTPIEGVSSFLSLRTGMHIEVKAPASIYSLTGDFTPLSITVLPK